MTSPVTLHRMGRTRRDCSPAILAAQLCTLLVMLLVTVLGGVPLVEVHAHAGGEYPHSHQADHAAGAAHADDHADPPAGEAPSRLHVHESTVVAQAMPEVDAMALDDPKLSSPTFQRLATGRGAEPPAPPRRPPIA